MQGKVELSRPLEEAFFGAVLKKREVEALRARCESYQNQEPPGWSPALFPSYSQYFGFLSALKARAVFLELAHYGYLKPFEQSGVEMIDFGAGTLGASLGAVDVLSSLNVKVKALSAVDKDPSPSEWSLNLFRDFLPPSVNTTRNSPSSMKPGQILIAVDVLNEIQDWSFFESILLALPKSSLCIFIEPASRETNHRLLRWRDSILGRLSSETSLLLPCPHSMACPALADGEWCHEERDYKAPSAYWNLVHSMGFQRSRLTYSTLVFGNQPSAFGPHHARVVSQILRPKGRCEKWLCSDGKRWKMGLLERHRNESNEFVYEARRGEVLDRTSSTLKELGV